MPTAAKTGETEYEFDLRVLRLPPGEADAPPRASGDVPPPLLRECFAAADEEYRRLAAAVDRGFYHDLAVPAHAEADPETAQALIATLDLDDSFPGVFGPQHVAFEGRVYKVWIQAYPCG